VLADRAQLLRDRLVLAPRRILALLRGRAAHSSAAATAPLSSTYTCDL